MKVKHSDSSNDKGVYAPQRGTPASSIYRSKILQEFELVTVAAVQITTGLIYRDESISLRLGWNGIR